MDSRVFAALLCALIGAAVVPGAGGSTPQRTEGTAAAAAPILKGVSRARTVKGTSIAVPRPRRVGAGDVLVAGIGVRARSLRPPAGWKLIRADANRGRGVELTNALYYHVAAAREPALYRWRFASRRSASGGLLAYQGVDAAQPMLAHSGRFRARSRAAVAPGVKVSSAPVRVVGFFAASGRAAMTLPRGMARRYAVRGLAARGASALAADFVQTVASATGARVARLPSRHGGTVGQLVVLRSGPGTTAPPPPPPPGGPPPPPPGPGGPALPPPLPPSTGQIFYVATTGNDANPGTIAQPWLTVQKALNTLQPGQRALVRAGTYSQNHRWDRAGTAAQPVTLAAYPGERPVLRAAASGDTYPVEISGSYFRLQGFVIENARGTSGANVYPTGPAHHLEISNNEIRFSQDQGIYADPSTHDIQVLGNLIRDNGFGHVPGQHQSHGIYVEGARHLIANNVIQDHPFGFGIQIYPENTGSIITANTVVSSGYSGIVVGGSGGVNNIVVVNNVFAFNAQYGVSHDSACPTASRADHNIVYGNGFGQTQGACSGLDYSRGNRTTNPLFVNYGLRDLHLNPGSSAIDYALPEYSPGADFDGRGRPQSAPDAGAYERP
jgi:Right handed beta helix region